MDESKSIQCTSSSRTPWKHDVFVSFRGEDTRNNFVDHLFGAFRREGIAAFRDDSNLKQGDHISTELMEAIEGSHVLIVVFSKNYANSSWCLDELAKIVDCIQPPTRQSVLPVFYDVTPSEVRRQRGDYGKAFAKHEQRIENHLLQRWMKALVQVADLSGCDVQNKPQYEMIENIVKRVKSILGCKLTSDLDGLVGMDSRIEQLEKLLVIDSSDDVRLVGICGMGGIGKSTLARAVYDRNLHRFSVDCFIDDISKVYHGGEGRISAQKQLICQIQKEEFQAIWNVFQANNLIKSMLYHQKALIVVDNVDDVEQLEELGLNRQYLCAGNRIIICSRDKHILRTYGVDEIYDAQTLDYNEAHLLFCERAFKRGHIMSGDDISNKEFEELTNLALRYAQGLPLAIKVLGSFLCGRDIFEWRSTLDRLRDNPEKKIMDILRVSFDGLRQDEKEIFLHIACFLDFDIWIILNHCGFPCDIGISVLVEKSLITVVHGKIEMHDLLRELGKNIVRQEAPNEPSNWSRIWHNEDFQNLMFVKMEMENIQFITLKYRWHLRNTTYRAEAISRMNRLKVVILRDINFSGRLHCLSNELRHLEWKNYPFNYFPSSCELIHLVKLILIDSNLKQLWEGIKRMDHLKVMNLSFSQHLEKTPDFNGTPNLKVLILAGGIKLAYIHPSIGHLKKLVKLNLDGCTSLTSLPNNIYHLSSLAHVVMSGCSKVFEREGVIQCQSRFSFFRRLKPDMWPFEFPHPTNDIDIVASEMPSLSRLCCLQELNLEFCGLLSIPKSIALLCCLEKLVLAGNNFVTLPCFIEKLPRLIWLELDDCNQLTYVSGFPLPTVIPVGEELEGILSVELGVIVRMLNCPKLVEMESLSISAVSWMRQFLKVHMESSPPVTMVIPVSETQIPCWFKHQREGGSITTGSFPSVHDTDWIGVSFCATFVIHYHPTDPISKQMIFCEYGARYVTDRRLVDGVGGENGIELVHLCLLYFTRQQLINHIPVEMANMNVDGFSFKIKPFQPFGLEVKNCGVRMVFKQDLEEINCDGQ